MTKEMDSIISTAAISLSQTASPFNLFGHSTMKKLIRDICDFSNKTGPESVDLLVQRMSSQYVISRRAEKIKKGLEFVSRHHPTKLGFFSLFIIGLGERSG